MKLIVIGCLILFGFGVYSAVHVTEDCIDCFNFSAPSIASAENIVSPEVGLIVQDASKDTFRGFSTTSGWQKLTNTLSVHNSIDDETLDIHSELVLADSTAGAFILTLPTAVGATGKVITIKKTDSSSNLVTIDGNSSETIDGSTTFVLGNINNFIKIVSDGTNWTIIAKNLKHRFETDLLSTVKSTLANTWEDAQGTPSTITLYPGTWKIGYDVSFGVEDTSNSDSNVIYGNVAVAKTDDTILDETISIAGGFPGALKVRLFGLSRSTEITITSTTSYKIMMRSRDASADGEVHVTNDTITTQLDPPDNFSNFWAERVE